METPCQLQTRALQRQIPTPTLSCRWILHTGCLRAQRCTHRCTCSHAPHFLPDAPQAYGNDPPCRVPSVVCAVFVFLARCPSARVPGCKCPRAQRTAGHSQHGSHHAWHGRPYHKLCMPPTCILLPSSSVISVITRGSATGSSSSMSSGCT